MIPGFFVCAAQSRRCHERGPPMRSLRSSAAGDRGGRRRGRRHRGRAPAGDRGVAHAHRTAAWVGRRPGAGASVALIGLAAGTGVAAGLVAALVALAIDAATRAGTGPLLPVLPVLGGMAYGLAGHLLAPGARGLGVPDVMLDLAAPRPRVGRARTALARVVCAVLCVGTGGQLGGEG